MGFNITPRSIWTVVIVLTVAAAISSQGCVRLDFTVPASAEKGAARLRAGDLAGARTGFDAAIREHPDDVRVYAWIIQEAGKASQRDLVSEYYRKGLDNLPRKSTADRGRLAIEASAVFEQLGDRPTATLAAEEAYRTSPGDYLVLNNLGYMYAESGTHVDRAVELTEKAVKAARARTGVDSVPDEVLGLTAVDSLGWAYYKAGRLDEAISTLNSAAEMAPGKIEIYYHLAMAYHARGKEEGAVAALKQCEKLHSQTPKVNQEVVRLRQVLELPPL